MSNSPALRHRREVVFGTGLGLGAVALNSLLASEGHTRGNHNNDQATAKNEQPQDKAGKRNSPSPHHTPTATQVIFLMMEGGPSHLDTFDPKPILNRLHLTEFVREGRQKSAMESGRRYYVRSPFQFRRAGESGADMAVTWEHLQHVADDLCFYRGCQVDSVNHPTAMYQMNCGNRFGGDPAAGAWVTYGLGTENQDVPGFIVLPEVSYPQGGSANWSNGYLPASFQGTALRSSGAPLLDLNPPQGITSERQRRNLDLLKDLDSNYQKTHPLNTSLEARMMNYELAFRMQTEVPDLLDLNGETQKTLADYGLDRKETAAFGRKCLLARRLIEKGVRFVQLYHGTWDSHDDIQRAHGNLIRSVDRPIAALIADLKARGLLETTLVVWCGEFGRTPDNGVRGGVAYGRDHNPNAMTIWLAGGGSRAGHTIGATDETGMTAVDEVHHVRDFHVTLLHLLGLDDNRLTYYHGGRFKQLSQFGGAVIQNLLDRPV
ncbi:MAG: DUF1501 domain-containing protein [Planctomycetaceae bacterium]